VGSESRCRRFSSVSHRPLAIWGPRHPPGRCQAAALGQQSLSLEWRQWVRELQFTARESSRWPTVAAAVTGWVDDPRMPGFKTQRTAEPRIAQRPVSATAVIEALDLSGSRSSEADPRRQSATGGSWSGSGHRRLTAIDGELTKEKPEQWSVAGPMEAARRAATPFASDH